ncbi:hypothetical protein IEQ34_000406 [Dendrobium chrysotoxum]|uniref:Transcription factor CBF/NF-Y/archaeal histone domain-containing protein n=1 Tax=Dendrobium chrysotoxum TaxID=161865 RepID=A0AAV7HS50_DENCH|nr:hypothetical protein IEQ34_000406 [Dendrobium chrysotoxum]
MDEIHESNITMPAKVKGCSNMPDFQLPTANIGRIMKLALPPNAKISKEAKETMQDCACRVHMLITGEASVKQTLFGDDICHAMKSLGLDEYAIATNRYLQKYREHYEKPEASKNTSPIQIDVRDQFSVYSRINQHT